MNGNRKGAKERGGEKEKERGREREREPDNEREREREPVLTLELMPHA